VGILKVKLPDNTWADVVGSGATGPSGGPVPAGGNSGEVVIKTGPGDFEVGWEAHPRVAFNEMVATSVSSATVNSLTRAVEGFATIHPDRMYHTFAGVRCIQDPGATTAIGHFAVAIGTVNLAQWDEVTTPDTGLWGSWHQSWLNPGSDFTATTASLDVRLNIGCSIASKTFYHPRLYIIEY